MSQSTILSTLCMAEEGIMQSKNEQKANAAKAQ